MPIKQTIGDYEFVMTQSPYGLTVDYEGVEILKYFPKNGSYSAVLPGGTQTNETQELAPGTHTFENVELGADEIRLIAPGRRCNITVEVLP